MKDRTPYCILRKNDFEEKIKTIKLVKNLEIDTVIPCEEYYVIILKIKNNNKAVISPFIINYTSKNYLNILLDEPT